MANSVPNQRRQPPLFYKARQRIVEEMALQMVCESIVPDGNIELPSDWVRDAENMKEFIFSLIDQEVARK